MPANKPALMSSRRRFLKNTLLLSAAGCLPGISWASTTDGSANRLVVIILRGAMDGLAAVVPYSEPSLLEFRGSLVPPDNTLLKLDNHFALHPAFANMFQMHQSGELGILHATATPYRQRSHFDGQNVLESGLDMANNSADGWLNRAIAYNSTQQAMVIGQAMPLVLRGAASTASWSPAIHPALTENTMGRLTGMYAEDAFLGPRLEQALFAQGIAGSSGINTNSQAAPTFPGLVDAAVGFLTTPDNGPDLVVLESEGWDTHANQGNEQGQLPRKFAELDAGLNALKQGMGQQWANTSVVVVTEFGRTVRVNGSGGSDHGTGGVAFVAGGALSLSGAQALLGDWPGVAASQLYEGRDLQPANDMRSLLKTVMHQHMGYSRSALDEIVFPGSSHVSLIEGLYS